MPGPANLTLVGLDGVTTAVAGPSLGIQGQAISLSSGGKANNLYAIPFSARAVLIPTGGSPSATVVIETAPLGASSWTQWGSSLVFSTGVQQTLPPNSAALGKLPTSAVYIRMRVSAINNAEINGLFDIPGG